MTRYGLERIGYVDDDVTIGEIAQFALREIGGFEVALFSSGQEAIDAMTGFGPELILLDMIMPGMDGLETLRHLRAIPSLGAVPVVFLSGRSDPREVAHFLEQGAIGFIPKPFDPMLLADSVNAIWARCQDTVH